MTNNYLAALGIGDPTAPPPNPAAPWQPKPTSSAPWNATGSDPSGYLRSVMRDGEVVNTETGRASIGSSATASEEANARLGVPYERAEDPRTRNRIRPQEVTPDSILTFHDGAQMTLAQSWDAGYIPAGVVPGKAAPQDVQSQQASRRTEGKAEILPEAPKAEDVHPDLKTDALPDQGIEKTLTTLIENTGGVEQMDAVKQIVEGGAINERTLGALASQLGTEPGQLQASIAPIMKAFETQARAVMSAGGLDSDAVVAWAQQHAPDKLQQAMHKQGTLRQTSGYADIRQGYLESLADHNQEAAMAADLGPGVTKYIDKGKVIVRLPTGATMHWREAIRAYGPK